MRKINTHFLCAFFLICILCPSHARADIYTIEDVEIDVSAANAVEAREKAFEEAQLKAYEMLAERVLPADEFETFTMPDLNTISAFVKDFEVTNERLSTTRYIGTYTIRFLPNAVRSSFDSEGLNYTDLQSSPILILPFFEQGGRTILWDRANPFMQAWGRYRNTNNALVPVIIPIGDLLDVSQMREDTPFQYDPLSLNQMLKRYKASEAIILIGRMQDSFAQTQTMAIDIYQTDSGSANFVKSIQISAMGEENIFDKAVRDTHKAIRKDWKEQSSVMSGQVQSLTAKVEFSNIQQWVETKRVLDQIPGIQDVVVKSLKPNRADLNISYAGTENRLRLAMAQADITLLSPVTSPYAWQERVNGGGMYTIYLNRFRAYQ